MKLTPIRVVRAETGHDELGTEVLLLAIRTGDGLYACHSSFHRGGCLFAGTIILRDLTNGGSKEIDVTSEARDTPEHAAYLDGLARKHLRAGA